MDSLQKLSLPAETLERVKQLIGDLRLLCAKEVFKEAIEGKFFEILLFLNRKALSFPNKNLCHWILSFD